METKSLVKCILFLGHTSRFVSHFPRMSPAISFVCWIRRGKDTDDVYVSFSRRKGFRRDRFSLQYFFPPSLPPPLRLPLCLSQFPFCFHHPVLLRCICFFLQVMALPRHFRLCLRVSEMPARRATSFFFKDIGVCWLQRDRWGQGYEEGGIQG